MPHRAALLALLLAGCHYTPSPESVFRAKTAPIDVQMKGDPSPGSQVRVGAIELEVLEAAGARTDDELVSASVRGALADAALAAAATSAVAKAANEEETASAADHASRALAVAAVLGSLVAASDEKSEALLRAKVEGRVYRATCTSTEQRSIFDPYARPSLSCAVVAAVEAPKRHWALTVRTPTAGIQVPRHQGYVEARTAKGRDDTVPILRIYTTDSAGTTTGPDGKPAYYTQHNASFELVTPQTRVASITLRSYGAKPQVWLDTSGLADAEARDVAGVATAILSLYRWPELDDREKS